MPRLVVPDTSCLIALTSLERLDILQRLYPEVAVMESVAEEYEKALPEWMKRGQATHGLLVRMLRDRLASGEAEVIAYTSENADAIAVLDDLKARNTARDLGVAFTGTLGILLKAKAQGLIPSIRDALAALDQTHFRISTELRSRLLELAEED